MKRENKTQYALLGILTQYECTGYDMKKFIETSIGYFWSESFGQIYPNLKKLEQQGLIRKARTADAKGSDRIIYAITPAGRKKLQQWLAKPAEPLAERNELLLKLFFGSQLDHDGIRQHLRRHQQTGEETLKVYAGVEKDIAVYKDKSPDYPFWRMTLDYGVERTKMELKWVKSANEILDSIAKTKKTGRKKS
ncbi:MAG TPA: PadR family transcriptional regulator [Turneriella sp.]|nr:PadR family transcriptional regulator [Turneriella sp.]HMY11284.1 PadR family transcriptional regulator [Turneriella sp.]HNA79880.1 PadR family transcriptional regulator [Turneriella sp.]HNE21026.1 PadR family transcriptional regulator [Turneriella sp.]HNL54308.1 PadR family transcriptional regulator [Turneriella sp.]